MGTDRNGNEVKSLIDMVLVKKEMLKFVMDVKAVRGLGMGISDHYIVLCKIVFVGAWMERKEKRTEMGRIRSEKLREQICKDEYVMTLETIVVEWEQMEIEQVWEQVKEAVVVSAKEVCGCVKIGGRNVNSEL